MKAEETDIIILGGGVAALAMAAEASRRGLRARILEMGSSVPRPRHSVFLQPKALSSLARLDLFDAARDRGAVIERIRIFRDQAIRPSVELDYADAGTALPFALAMEWRHLERILVGTFDKYHAIFREPEVEVTGLLREHGRIRGLVVRGPDGDASYRAWTTIIATDAEKVLQRTELSPRRPGVSYRASHVALQFERPSNFSTTLDIWLGGGFVVASYPLGTDQLQVEVTGAAATVGSALSGGADTFRALVLQVAPPLTAVMSTLTSPLDVEVTTPGHGRARSWVGEARVLVGPAAYQLSPCSFASDTQSVLDAAAVSLVLSKGTFKGDFSRLALEPLQKSRRLGFDSAANLAHDMHRLGLARSGPWTRLRDAAFVALADSAKSRRQFIHAFAGLDDQPLSIVERLRLGGLLPRRPDAAATLGVTPK